jgi:hypothetical protein
MLCMSTKIPLKIDESGKIQPREIFDSFTWMSRCVIGHSS